MNYRIKLPYYRSKMTFIKLSTQLLLFMTIAFLIIDVSVGKNIDTDKLHKANKNAQNYDMSKNTNENEGLTGEGRLEVINEVLEHLFDDDEDESTTEFMEQLQTEEALKFFMSTKTKTLKTTITSTRSLTSYHTCYKANPELPICNRRKRDANVDRDSVLEIQPHLSISLIRDDKHQQGGKDVTDLTWQDVISPTRVARKLEGHDDDLENVSKGSAHCHNELPRDYKCSQTCEEWADGGHCNHGFQHSNKHRHCTNSTGPIRIYCKKACNYCEQQKESRNYAEEKQGLMNTSETNIDKKENTSTLVSEQAPNPRNEVSPLNLPQDSFGDEWIEREIEGLDRRCYDSGNFANRFITILMTNLVTETAVETTLIESNQVNTVYFNKNEQQEGCLPADVSEFFTSSCV